MSQNCVACSPSKAGTKAAKVFDVKGNPVTISLCLEHDIELYKLGQLRFTTKYQISIKATSVLDALKSANDLFNDFR